MEFKGFEGGLFGLLSLAEGILTSLIAHYRLKLSEER
jgi:hypothetical protein